MDLASSMTLYGSTPLPDALNLPQSVVSKFLSGKAFEDFRKGKEAELKMQAAIVGRLNEVIRGLGIVAKVSGGARSIIGRR